MTIRVDPSGLFVGMAFHFGGMALDGWMSAVGSMNDAMQGISMIRSFENWADEYSISMIQDVNWATDWSQPDSWYNRSGVSDEAMYGSGSSGSVGGQSVGPAMAGGAFPGQSPSFYEGHIGRTHNLRKGKATWHNARLHALAEHFTGSKERIICG